MWTAPCSQGEFAFLDRIACVHMSGLLMRSHMNAGQDGFRAPGSYHRRDLVSATGTFGVFRVPDRSITPSAGHIASSYSAAAGLMAALRGIRRIVIVTQLRSGTMPIWGNSSPPTP